MARNKQKQIDEVKHFDNVFSAWDRDCEPEDMQGMWQSEHFGNEGEVVLELACGWGQYTLALGQRDRSKNFIGIDKKGDRIWMGAKQALDEPLETGLPGKFGENAMRNVAFLQMEIQDLGKWFGPEEVAEIWITFPDPHPKPCKAKQRLVSERFLKVYRQVLRPGGLIHLKTDNEDLFEYALEVLEQEKIEPEILMRDVHGGEEIPEILKLKTFYEKKFEDLGAKINYLRFQLTDPSSESQSAN
jgi:tRNA (guanine-N7-)-methyltransferase